MTILDNKGNDILFKLQKLEDFYADTSEAAGVLQNDELYTFIIVEEAKGVHTIDYIDFPFDNSEIHFIRPYQVHGIALDKASKGHVISVAKSYFLKHRIREELISNIFLFQDFGHTPPLKIDQDIFERISKIIEEIEACLADKVIYREEAIASLLQLFLIYCNNSSGMNTAQTSEEHPGICILRDFKRLVEKHFSEWHRVTEYAYELHISVKHLSQSVKNLTDKAAKEHIQDRITLEAKRILLNSNLSIKEVAQEIGFEEPLPFSGFFKKKVGVSPSQFRQDNSY